MDHRYLLLVSRNFPPQVGGLEKYSYDLYHALKDELNTDLLKHNGGKWYLPIFFMHCLVYIFVNRKEYTHIHFTDAALSPLAYLAGKITHSKISITVHALDVIFDNRIYQAIVPACMATADNIVAVSHYAMQQCVQRGIDAARCYVIPNGINPSELDASVPSLGTVLSRFNIDSQNKKILLSVGRLIKRKGVVWFVDQVMSLLDDEYLYLVAGDGPEFGKIAALIKARNLAHRVYLLGRISDMEKYSLYQHADFFIMPNIRVPGDAEGFGITIIEAAAYGLPAIASNLEGIPDTMVDGETGRLVEQGNAEQYVDAISASNFNKGLIKLKTRERYAWFLLKNDYLHKIFS
jgi:glycosyltransferase involved in cell wall biosynthesis